MKTNNSFKNGFRIMPADEITKRFSGGYKNWASRALPGVNVFHGTRANANEASATRHILNPDSPDSAFTQKLSNLADRIKFMHGEESAQAVAAGKMVTRWDSILGREDGLKELANVYAAASRDDAESNARLQKIVHRIADCYIMASSTFGKWWGDPINLAEDETPVATCRWPQHINVQCIGKDGKPDHVQPVRVGEKKPVPLCWLATDIYDYQLCDSHFGRDVKRRALANVDLAADWAMQLECILKQFILVGSPDSMIIGDFVTDGPFADRHYVAHPKVDISNFPSGNLIELEGNSDTSRPRKALIDAILHYAGAWGVGAFGDDSTFQMKPACIVLPSADFDGIFMDLDATAAANCYTDKLCDDYGYIDIAGCRIQILGDNTLSPAAGVAYVYFQDACVGDLYRKPDLDMIDVDEDKRENIGSICQAGVFGVSTYKCHTPRALAVQYRDEKEVEAPVEPPAPLVQPDTQKVVVDAGDLKRLINEALAAREGGEKADKKSEADKPKTSKKASSKKTAAKKAAAPKS